VAVEPAEPMHLLDALLDHPVDCEVVHAFMVTPAAPGSQWQKRHSAIESCQ
jgi:hypothetical protein